MRPAAFACLLLLTASSLTRESNPPRIATEELLISATIDRAVDGLKLDFPKSTSVYLYASDFEGTDSKYAVSDIIERVLLARAGPLSRGSTTAISSRAALTAASKERNALRFEHGCPSPAPA